MQGLNAPMHKAGKSKGSGKSSVKSSKVGKPVVGGKGKVKAPIMSNAPKC